jgi:ferredoxin
VAVSGGADGRPGTGDDDAGIDTDTESGTDVHTEVDADGGDDRYRADLRWRTGREETIRVAADETVFVAADAAGVSLPIGCRTGACGTCTGRLLSGELVHRRPPRALKDRHVDDGYVLLCVAEPRSDVEIEVGSRVARDLTSNPWK